MERYPGESSPCAILRMNYSQLRIAVRYHQHLIPAQLHTATSMHGIHVAPWVLSNVPIVSSSL